MLIKAVRDDEQMGGKKGASCVNEKREEKKCRTVAGCIKKKGVVCKKWIAKKRRGVEL
jgi:hypothetical protein